MTTHTDTIIPLNAIESDEARAFADSSLSADSLRALSDLDPMSGAGHDDMRRVVYRWCERHGISGYLDWTPGDPASMHYVMWPDATADGVRRIMAILNETDCRTVADVVPDAAGWNEALCQLTCEVLPNGTFRLYGLGQAIDFETPAAIFEYIESLPDPDDVCGDDDAHS